MAQPESATAEASPYRRGGRKTVAANTGLDVYFADPRSPWQRGTNETRTASYANACPKGETMGHLTQDDLDARRLNTRPARPSTSTRRPIG
jgi:IS30 family transposase